MSLIMDFFFYCSSSNSAYLSSAGLLVLISSHIRLIGQPIFKSRIMFFFIAVGCQTVWSPSSCLGPTNMLEVCWSILLQTDRQRGWVTIIEQFTVDKDYLDSFEEYLGKWVLMSVGIGLSIHSTHCCSVKFIFIA